MKYVFFGSLIILLIPLLFCIYKVQCIEKKPLRNAVLGLLISQAAMVMFYGMALMTLDEKMAVFFYCLFYYSVVFVMFSLSRYSRVYTNTCRNRLWISVIACILLVLDALILFSNMFTHSVFQVVNITDRFGTVFYVVKNYGNLYFVHVIISYLFGMFGMGTLFYRKMKCPKVFRVNYRSVLIMLVITMFTNILFFQIGGNYDFSLIGYTLSCCAITYFTFFHVPAGLVEKMLSLFVKTIDDGVICYDLKGKCIHANEPAKRVLKLQDNSMFDKELLNWLDCRNLQDLQENIWTQEVEIDGKTHFFQFEYKKIIYDKHYIGSFFLMHDQTEETERVKLEQYKANHDGLTGLYNREYFCRRAEQKLRENEDVKYYIVCSDIRDFKIVNDVYGMKKGDEILIKQAESLKSKSSPDCLYGRLSGDRFAILVPKEEFQESVFRRELSRIEQIEGNSNFRLRIYMGVYEVDNLDTPVAVMCARAVMAIKTIKDDAANRIVYYDKELRENALKEQSVIGQFHDALESGQFCFYIQPQISSDGIVRGGEALVRWIHPERGMIPPGEFIELFERTGLISELDRYIWEKACIQLRDWRRQGHADFYLSVNISPRDFYYMDIYKVFTGLVQTHGFEAKNLHLEITETAVMTDTKKVIRLVNKLRQYGFKVEMDDFGSGYSSLNMLKDIKMDTIKLDMGFLRKTQNNERSMSIVRNVIQLSKRLGMEVVTEGVETLEQVEALTNMGCDVFQGYYFAKPMSVWDYEDKYIPMEG